MKQKAIIYARVSTFGDKQSTDRQINDLFGYAKTNNIEVVNVFKEHCCGAVKNEQRAELNNAIEYAKNNSISLILFSEMSRLGRNSMELLTMLKYMSDNNIDGFFQKENFKILDENGNVNPITLVYCSCLSMVAEIERTNIKYRLQSGYNNALKNGVKMGRKIGYRESIEDKEKKYPIALKYIRKGYKNSEVLAMAKAKGEKISIATIKRLKKGE